MVIGKVVPIILLSAGVFAGIMNAPTASIVPAVELPIIWDSLVSSPEMTIELDPNSVKVEAKNGGWEVASRFKIGFFKEIEIKNKKEKGWYYINEMSAVCKDNVIRIDKSTVYSKEGKALVTGKNLGELRNPNDAKQFVTVWLYVACSDLKKKPLPTIA